MNNNTLDTLGKAIISECLDGGLQHFDSLRKKDSPPPIFTTLYTLYC